VVFRHAAPPAAEPAGTHPGPRSAPSPSAQSLAVRVVFRHAAPPAAEPAGTHPGPQLAPSPPAQSLAGRVVFRRGRHGAWRTGHESRSSGSTDRSGYDPRHGRMVDRRRRCGGGCCQRGGRRSAAASRRQGSGCGCRQRRLAR
jgi:hypothetical protein